MQTSWQEVVEVMDQTRDKQIQYWLHESLFSFSWWVLLIVTIGTLIVWLKLVDKKRMFEIITYGFMVEIIAIVLDKMGVLIQLWEYKHTLTPLPTMVEIHVILMPLIYMMLYQYFHTWKTFLIAVTVNAFVFAFILEPILVWLEIYELNQWRHIYSFLPYIFIAAMCKGIMSILKSPQQ